MGRLGFQPDRARLTVSSVGDSAGRSLTEIRSQLRAKLPLKVKQGAAYAGALIAVVGVMEALAWIDDLYRRVDEREASRNIEQWWTDASRKYRSGVPGG
jgi:hypothetical protein